METRSMKPRAISYGLNSISYIKRKKYRLLFSLKINRGVFIVRERERSEPFSFLFLKQVC